MKRFFQLNHTKALMDVLKIVSYVWLLSFCCEAPIKPTNYSLQDRGGKMNFDAASERILGEKNAALMLKLQSEIK